MVRAGGSAEHSGEGVVPSADRHARLALGTCFGRPPGRDAALNGLDGPVQTLRSLGADLGISAERVRQLEQQALDTLHAAATQAPTSS